MNTSKYEYLSAVYDGESGQFEQRRILDEIQHDDNMKATFANYALVGEVMREGMPKHVVKNDFLERLNERLGDEIAVNDDYPVEKNSTVVMPEVSRWFRPAAGLAVASVAAVASVLVLKIFSAEPTVSDSQVAFRTIPSVVQPQTDAVESDTSLVMKQFISDHVQNASMRSVVPTIEMSILSASAGSDNSER